MDFGYDANGRVVKAMKANTPDALSVYDSAGQKVAERVSDVWKFNIYDLSGEVVAEYGGIQLVDEGGVKYPFQDWQASTRTIISNSGFVQSREDYTGFGEEINVGVGQRTAAQGFDTTNNLNQKYAQTERDAGTGQDHTWFRKLENKAGRWTSPDPYNGSMNIGDPQSFNRYAYVNNQPTNFTDPSGLMISVRCGYELRTAYTDGQYESSFYVQVCYLSYSPDFYPSSGGINEVGGVDGGGDPSPQQKTPCDVQVSTDRNDRAVVGTLLGEATPYGWKGQRGYAPEQGNSSKRYPANSVPDPAGAVIDDQALFNEARFIVSSIYNRVALGYAGSPEGVASQKGQYIGYKRGMGILNRGKFGYNGGALCEMLRNAVNATEDVKQNGVREDAAGVVNYRGVLQAPSKNARIIRDLNSKGPAVRLAGSDFMLPKR